MIISAITIENFKSIKKPVRIELKPITLLFGPNSVGKSTIIQALHYAWAIMKKRDINADYTETGGDTIRLGGFYNLVHNHDINNIIRIKFELSLPEYLHYDLFQDSEDTIEEELRNFPEDISRIKRIFLQKIKGGESPWLELLIKQDAMEKEPYVAEESIGFGDEQFIKLTAKSNRVSMILRLDNSILPEVEGESLVRKFFFSLQEKSNDNEEQKEFLNAIDSFHFGLPCNTIRLNINGTSLKEYFEKALWDTFIRFENILNSVWKTINDALVDDLNDFRYIGPLRTVPDSDFKPSLKYDRSRWANGMAAWDSLIKGDWDISIVNEWLSRDFFNTGYQIVRKQLVELDIDSNLYQALIAPSDQYEKTIEKLKQLPIKGKLYIKKEHSEVVHSAKDIGVGLSQLLPIIPLALGGGWDHEGVIAIEQPELHIHPAMQVVLGDLFIEGLDYEVNMPGRKRFLLETHSEHLLLRLLRRIREPRKESLVRLHQENLSVYFLEPDISGVKATRLKVNEEGEFKDEWPLGFFEEREEELL